MEQINSRSLFNRSLAHLAIRSKVQTLRQAGIYTHALYDNLVFNKIKQAFGGNIKLIITAGAPLRAEIAEFLSIAVICPLVQVFGMSETGVVLMMIDGDKRFDHCGGPTLNFEVKLQNVPEMEYTNEDLPFPRGELCFRGPCTFLGYYHDKESTNEFIDKDQWMHSGDIAELTSNGSLKLIDRKKNIFKLAQGEYIAAEQLENIYGRVEGVEEIYVHGESIQYYLFAIIVPKKKYLEKVAQELNINYNEWKELCDNKKIKTRILENCSNVAKEEKLNGLQILKKVYLDPVSFEENKLLTTSFKLKRYQARQHYAEIFKKYYI